MWLCATYLYRVHLHQSTPDPEACFLFCSRAELQNATFQLWFGQAHAARQIKSEGSMILAPSVPPMTLLCLADVVNQKGGQEFRMTSATR